MLISSAFSDLFLFLLLLLIAPKCQTFSASPLTCALNEVIQQKIHRYRYSQPQDTVSYIRVSILYAMPRPWIMDSTASRR